MTVVAEAGYLRFAGLGDARPAPRRAPEDWNPRWDATFEATWLSYLMSRYGQWCHATELWLPANVHQRYVLRQRAHEVVQDARRQGWVIQGDDPLGPCGGHRGYRLVGCRGLPKYVRVREAAAQSETWPGQLSLAECVGVGCEP